MLIAINVSQVTLPLCQTCIKVIRDWERTVRDTFTYTNSSVQVEYFFNCTNEEDLDSTDLEEQILGECASCICHVWI